MGGWSTGCNADGGNCEEFLTLYSSIFIQNSTDIILNDIRISDSNGVGLSVSSSCKTHKI